MRSRSGEEPPQHTDPSVVIRQDDHVTDFNVQACAEDASQAMNRIFRAGWFCLLPPSTIHLVSQVASAHAEDVVADLDTLLETLHDVVDLDGPPEWDDHCVDPETGEVDLEQQLINQRNRDDLAAGLDPLGLPMPATMRDVAHLLVRFGVITQTVGPEGERWRFADRIPLPEEVLTLRPEWLAQAQAMRN